MIAIHLMVVITDVVKYQHLQEAVDSDPELGA